MYNYSNSFTRCMEIDKNIGNNSSQICYILNTNTFFLTVRYVHVKYNESLCVILFGQ